MITILVKNIEQGNNLEQFTSVEKAFIYDNCDQSPPPKKKKIQFIREGTQNIAM